MMTREQEAHLISQSAHGATTRNIGAQLGVHASTVCRAQARLRDLIQAEATALLQRGLRPARRTLCRLAAAGNTPDADTDTRRLALDASKVILNAAQITGNAATPTNIITTLISITPDAPNSAVLSILQEFLSARMGDAPPIAEDDVTIDADTE